jgi:hypothetical protein
MTHPVALCPILALIKALSVVDDATALPRVMDSLALLTLPVCRVLKCHTAAAGAPRAGGAPKALDAIAACLTTGPLRSERVRLVGHADPRGTDAYNTKLGLSRAESVAKYLESHGIPADRIIVETHGAEHALDLPQAYPFDRRVDIERAQPPSTT